MTPGNNMAFVRLCVLGVGWDIVIVRFKCCLCHSFMFNGIPLCLCHSFTFDGIHSMHLPWKVYFLVYIYNMKLNITSFSSCSSKLLPCSGGVGSNFGFRSVR